jgi:glucose-6-phosphate isomerase
MDDSPRSMTAANALARLIHEDAIGQLRRRNGAMARLGSEDGALKLDWVEMVPWLLAHPDALADVEREASALIARGVRHIIWAGMGGSVLSVRVMLALGFDVRATILHPLDSTDPVALNTITRNLAGDIKDTVMIAVALGMTSEEPISHLEWFAGALREKGLNPAAHQMVMALPNSYLDRYARKLGLPQVGLQLDGGYGTGGRMSAPGTRVFLTPVALYIVGHGQPPGALGALLRQAWTAYDLDNAQNNPAGSQWVKLAVALAASAREDVVRLSLETPPGWEALRDWTEQLMEESLGKGGKGVLVFAPQALPADAPASLRVRLTSAASQDSDLDSRVFTIVEPLIASPDATERLAGLAALFLGLQLTMALFGYLWDIPFAGQPAVEAYKAKTRTLRDTDGEALTRPVFDNTPLRNGRLALAPPNHDTRWESQATLASVMANWLLERREQQALAYLDVTINGEADPPLLAALDASLRRLAVERLGIPYKLRRAPAAYHSSEQSEMDGPVGVTSLRAVALQHAEVDMGAYSARFLEAQALATWQAMNEQGRPCYLALYDGDATEMIAALGALLDEVAARLDALAF